MLSDVTFKAQVQRSGSNWSVRFRRSDTSEWTNWTTIGAVGSGLVTIRLVGLRFNMVPYGSSSRDVTVRVTNITTLSGAPSSVTVTTPVMDMGKSMKCTVQRVPSLAYAGVASERYSVPADGHGTGVEQSRWCLSLLAGAGVVDG